MQPRAEPPPGPPPTPAPEDDGLPPDDPLAPQASASDDPGDGRPRQVRGKALVAKVMSATISELARVGYENLAIEQVAEVASVNKTTIYRRWATRRELVQAALSEMADSIPAPPDTGSLREDLLVQMRLFRDLARHPAIWGLMRMLCGGQIHEDVATFAEAIRHTKEAEGLVIYTRAIARGELPADTDIRLLSAVVGGSIQNLVLFVRDPCDDARLDQVADLLLDGAFHRGKGRRSA